MIRVDNASTHISDRISSNEGEINVGYTGENVGANIVEIVIDNVGPPYWP